MRDRMLVAVLGVVVTATLAWTQDAAPPAKGKAAEFDRLHTQWKDTLAEMRQLRKEYQAAQPERRSEIQARWPELIRKGESILPRLIEAAEAAVAGDPKVSKVAGDFLLNVVIDRCDRQDYESAAALAKKLIELGYPEKRVYGFAGAAAFASGDFELAEKYLKVAKDESVMPSLKGDTQLAEQWMSDLPYYLEIGKKEKAIRAAEAKADDLPRVLLKTSKGDIELELFENEAPNTVANFISLVEKGFYNGTPFHRVLDNFMAQGGDPTGSGSGGPGYAIRCECYEANHRLHFRGTLSMAHAGRDTGGSQFFLTFVPTHHLDGKHTVFGRVVKGMETLSKLQRRNPGLREDANVRLDKIVEAKVFRKRNHPYEPKTLPDPRKARE